MPNNPQRAVAHESNAYLARTAYHMADAVSFLIRVASDAGMRAVASKLAGVRTDLLKLAIEEGDVGPDPDVPRNHDGNGGWKDKPN